MAQIANTQEAKIQVTFIIVIFKNKEVSMLVRDKTLQTIRV